jgi:biofilm PGA synthesis N-glycosyltransferase PgaC
MIKYALMTAARNEESYIQKTLESVIAQTIRPQVWVIVDDRSTDRTNEIVRQYASEHDFIHLLTNEAQAGGRSFASKAKSLEWAYEHLQSLDFEYIGNLDADIALEPTYYETILQKMEADPKLGIAGGIRYDYKNGKFELKNCARNSVGGPIQMFRRACYEDIGGYQALAYGGIDAVAEVSARMRGWEVHSFPEIRVFHYRPTGTANGSKLSAMYRAGIRDYTIGYHPAFALVRIAKQIRAKPHIIGALAMLAGYMGAMIRREKRLVSPELVEFLHEEQLSRLRIFN